MRPAPFAAHWLRLRATSHASEDVARVRQAVRHVTGMDEAALAPRLTQTRLESQHGADFYLLEVELKRSPEIRALLGHVLSDEMRMRLLAELDMRVDEEGIFYLRLDKQEALAGRLVLGDADGIQLRLRPVVHPATREGALSALGALLAGRTA